MSTNCHGCGAPLDLGPRGRPRKWCSGRCRKASYGDPCVDCGAKTRFGAEMKRVPEPRCIDCHFRAETDRRVEKVVAMVRLRCDENLTNKAIAARLGVPPHTVATELNRMRSIGFDVPPSPYNGATLHVARPAPDVSTPRLAVALAERGYDSALTRNQGTP